ncbi:MAG: oligopeptide/dipeptide ABC transporter ATP-binding protein, partial [Coriobacteriia bacterium]
EGQPPSLIDVPRGCAFNPRCPFAQDRCRTESPVLREIVDGHYAACHFAGEDGFLRGEAVPVNKGVA